MYAVRELASLLPVSETNVVVNFVNPGYCWSNLDRNGPFIFRLGMWFGRLLFARSTEKGSRTLLHASVAGRESHVRYVTECTIEE